MRASSTHGYVIFRCFYIMGFYLLQLVLPGSMHNVLGRATYSITDKNRLGLQCRKTQRTVVSQLISTQRVVSFLLQVGMTVLATDHYIGHAYIKNGEREPNYGVILFQEDENDDGPVTQDNNSSMIEKWIYVF